MRPAVVTFALLAALAALAAPARADDPASIRGRVVDKTTGKPIAGAVIVGTGDASAVSDADGQFVLAGSGNAVLASADGYASAAVSASAADDDGVAIELTPDHGGEVVEITGRAPEDAKATSYTVTGDEIRSIPGAGNDALRALQGLPGVARIPFSFGGLVLRGTAPRDSHVFLDGIEVPLAFHFGGVTSFYPSSLLGEIELVNGGFSAEYGRGQGGIVALATRPARRDRWRVGSEVNLVDSAVRAEGPALGGGVTVGVRRSYIDAILAAVLPDDDRVLPRYYDAQLSWDTGDPRARRGALTAMVFFSDDTASAKDASVTSWFVRAAARWTRQLGPTRVTVSPWIGVNQLAFTGEVETPGGAQGQDATEPRTTYPGGLRASVLRDTAWGHVAGGLDLQGARYGHLAVNLVRDDQEITEQKAAETAGDVALWTEALWRVGGRLDVRPGARLEYYGDTGELVLDPRLNTSLDLGGGVTLHQALGLYHQPPMHADLDPATGNPMLRASDSVQASLGADVTLPGDTLVSVTGFAVDQRRLPAAVDQGPYAVEEPPRRSEGGLGPIFQQLLEAQLGSFEYRDNVGRGRSRGVEVSVKRHVGPLLTWLSYTYARAERTDDPARFDGWRPYELDQPHNLSAVVAWQRGAWRFGARVRATSGNPYTPKTLVWGADGVGMEVPGAPLSARLPTFVAVDARIDRAWRRPWGSINAYLDVQNATNHHNVEGADLVDGKLQYTDGLPILPILGFEYVPPP